MSEELKSVLTKVLASEGKKKFFFAYGTGKRKDGKGEGDLAVRTKKPKKTEIEAELTDCKEVFEGYCWTGTGPENVETVYFQAKGKKLSTPVVSKMALTAKKIANRQYDFQLPSAEEEARAEKLAHEGGEEGSVEDHGTTPEVGNKPVSPDDTLARAYQARVAALTDNLKKALVSGTPAGNEAKLRFAESQVVAHKQDFSQALALLDIVEQQIKLALTGVPNQATPSTDAAAEFKAKLAEWTPAIKAAMTAKGPSSADIAKLLAQATTLSKPGGDQVQALAKLTECHNLAIAVPKGPDLAPPGGQASADHKAGDRWKALVATAVVKLEAEIKVVRATNDPDAGKAELEMKAVQRQIQGAVSTQQEASVMQRYLEQDDVVADVCEFCFDIKTPLLTALGELVPHLAS